MGRPSDFTPDMGDRICQSLSSGLSLRQTCQQEGIPAMGTVLRWVKDFPAFREQYARAREDLQEFWAEDILSVSDDPTITSDQKRIMVDSRKWLLSKLAPKKYGDKLALGGSDEMPPLKVTAVDVRG
jgi:hypothetical protein